MEFFWNNDAKVATNVFELGLKTFSRDPDYVLQYLDYLIRTNNPNSESARGPVFLALSTDMVHAQTPALCSSGRSLSWSPRRPRLCGIAWRNTSTSTAITWRRRRSFSATRRLSPMVSSLDFPLSRLPRLTLPALVTASPIERFAQRHGAHGLENAITRDLGLAPRTSAFRRDEDRPSRSPSPARGPSKRGASVDPAAYDNGAPGAFGAGGPPSTGEYKRFKPNAPEGSPAPSSNGGEGIGGQRPWGAPPPAAGADDFGGSSGRRRPLDAAAAAPALNRPVPYMLDPRGDNVAVLPDAVVFFLSLLPSAEDFTSEPAFLPPLAHRADSLSRLRRERRSPIEPRHPRRDHRQHPTARYRAWSWSSRGAIGYPTSSEASRIGIEQRRRRRRRRRVPEREKATESSPDVPGELIWQGWRR